MLEYLQAEARLKFRPWPRPSQAETVAPARGFEVAFGAALQALGHSVQPVSLLPEDYRANWQKRLVRQRINLASLVMVLVCALLLIIGTWQKISLGSYKSGLLAKVSASRESVRSIDGLTGQLLAQYQDLRPLLAGQQFTINALNTLALLQQSRSNRSLWYVLLADQQSYFLGPAFTLTNKPPGTNLPAKPLFAELGPAANPSLARPGLIAELCVPETPDTARGILSELVNDLKRQPLFSKVDQLSEDQRRGLANPKVVVPNRHFVLELDFAAADFEQPLPAKRPPAAPPGSRAPASAGRTGPHR